MSGILAGMTFTGAHVEEYSYKVGEDFGRAYSLEGVHVEDGDELLLLLDLEDGTKWVPVVWKMPPGERFPLVLLPTVGGPVERGRMLVTTGPGGDILAWPRYAPTPKARFGLATLDGGEPVAKRQDTFWCDECRGVTDHTHDVYSNGARSPWRCLGCEARGAR